MTEINKVAVVGSGVMGAAIAAHIANAGVEVLLLDIVPDGAGDRNQLAKGAIEKLLKTDPAPLTHKRNAKRITPGNLEDDLAKIQEEDWIIEAIVERLDIKQSLYRKLEAHRKPGSIVSSNTSTLPLHVLTKDMPETFQKDFLISHFFNPPRYMRLLELVAGEKTRSDAVEVIRHFSDTKLGKGVVDCNDTPGFIANRIGCYWLTVGLQEAMKIGISVEAADAVMGRPVGIPKTGVFGLMDLIGIDLLPLIAESFKQTLPETDSFIQRYELPKQVEKMIAEGYTGRKGKGGFYRLNTEGGNRVKEAVNLQTGQYNTAEKPRLESVNAAKSGLKSLVTHDDIGGQYAKAVLLETLRYAASLIPEIADDITQVDEAMRLGYNWKYGPFELIDRLGDNTMTGPQFLAQELEKLGQPVPELLKNAGDQLLYSKDGDTRTFTTISGERKSIPIPQDAWMLSDKKLGQKPVAKNPSASLWDVGDGVVCIEFHSKMNTMDPMSFAMMREAIKRTEDGQFKAILIGNDADNFCAGANIGMALFGANLAAYKMLADFIKEGQDTLMALKYAPVPVVAAPSGLALGGGCEILLHCDAVQAHIELYTGLVEVGVGLIPGWGGCKEMILRHLKKRAESDSIAAKLGGMFSFISPIKTLNTMPALEPVFRNISTARVAKSAEEARDMLILNAKSGISMNRRRVLADAKTLALELVENYAPPERATVNLPGKTARTAFDMALRSFVKSGKATPHDVVVTKALGNVISGGETDITTEISEQALLDLERAQFNELLRNPATLDRIEHMLETGKPLRN